MRSLVASALLSVVLAAAVLPGSVADAAETLPCTQDAPCRTATGTYLLSGPDGWDDDTPRPAVIFFHGHGSSARNVMRNNGLVRQFAERGYVLIVPDGSARTGRPQKGWPAHRRTTNRRDDIAFMQDVLRDVSARVALDRKRIFVTGFSSGGSMAWFMACFSPDRFAGYAPIAGALRRPIPDEACPNGPFRLLHIHGFADQQVPLEGRGIREWHQGDVFEALSVARATNKCRSNPTAIVGHKQFQCRTWSDNGCETDTKLTFCLHPKGHIMPRGWIQTLLRWFEPPR